MKEDELPTGWIHAKLGELRLPVTKADPRDLGNEYFKYVDISSIDPTTNTVRGAELVAAASAPSRARQIIEEGDILFSTVRPMLRKIARVGRELDGQIASTGFLVLRPSPHVSSKFLFYTALSEEFNLLVASMQRGVSYPAVRPGEVLELPIAVPPLAEQERIVDALEGHLSRLEGSVSTISASKLKLDRFAESIYRQALDGGFSESVASEQAFSIDHVSAVNSPLRIRKSRASKLDPISGYSLPENWLLVSMGDLAYASGYGTSVKCDYGAAGSPVLRIPNVQAGVLDLNDMKSAVDDSIDLSGYFVSPGDALFVRTNGSRNLIGRVGIVEKELRCAFASYLVRFRFSLDLVEPRWIQVVTQSPAWRSRIEQLAASSAGQFNLNIQSLSGLPIPLPPLQVQRDILAKVDEYCSISAQMGLQLRGVETRAVRLRESLLRQAFLGKLVPQDSSEESASILLERIRAERAVQAKTRRKRVGEKTPAASTCPAPSISSDPAGTFVQEELGL